MLLVGNGKEIIQDLKTHLSSKFDMKDIGVEVKEVSVWVKTVTKDVVSEI